MVLQQLNDHPDLTDEVLAALPKIIRVEGGRHDIERFARTYLPHMMESRTPEWHFQLDRLIERMYSENRQGVVVAAPRGFGKSTRLGQFRVLHSALYRRHRFILVISSTDAQAEMLLRPIKQELETSPLIRQDFGNLVGSDYEPPQTWNSTTLTLAWPDTSRPAKKTVRNEHPYLKDATMIASRGVGGALRGLRFQQYRPDLVICQPAGEKVLTPDEMKNIEDVTPGDRVRTHTGVWTEVSQVRSRLYTGDLISVSVAGALKPHRMTAEHKVWAIPCTVKTSPAQNIYSYPSELPRWIEARDLKPHDLVVHPVDTEVLGATDVENLFIDICGEEAVRSSEITETDTDNHIVNSRSAHRPFRPDEVQFVHNPEFWRLVGYFIGDGTFSSKDERCGVAFYFSKAERHLAQDVCRISERLWGHHSTPLLNSAGNQWVAHVSYRPLFSFFRSLYVGSHPAMKNLPVWAERLPVECQREFLYGYFQSDGHKVKKRLGSYSPTIVSVSLPLLERVQRMAWRLGVTSSIRWLRKEPKSSVICGRLCVSRVAYDIHFGTEFYASVLREPYQTVSGRRNRPRQWISDGKVFATVSEVTSEPVTDLPVYNFTVEHEDHSYVGLHIATHNCDDTEIRENVATPEQRAKIWEWFTSEIIPMIDPVHGKLIVIGTILHSNSLLTKLLSDENHYLTATYRAINPDGTSLWPERFTVERLEEIKATVGPRAFAQEYMNIPFATDAQVFKPEWFRPYGVGDVRFDENSRRWTFQGRPLRVFQAIDPAISDSMDADYFAACTIGVTDDRDVILMDVQARRGMDFPSQVAFVKDYYLDFRPLRVGIEEVAYQRALRQQILREASIPIKAVKQETKVHKQQRIIALDVHLANGKFFIRAASDGEPGVDDPSGTLRWRIHRDFFPFFDQAVKYPTEEHEDMLDALEMAMRIAGISLMSTPGHASSQEGESSRAVIV